MANAKTTKKSDTTIKAAEARVEDIRDAAAGAAGRVTEGAREFVRRSASAAKERSDNAYEMAEKYNDGLESAMKRFVDGYVSVLAFGAKAAHEDATRALTTLEKLAEAKSVSEAVKVQTEYVRENTQANVERARTAFGATRDVMVDGYQQVRDTARDAWPMNRAA